MQSDELHLESRKWKYFQTGITEQLPEFTVVSFNILSEQLLKHSSYFKKIKPEHWDREARHPKLLAELDSLNADILCLQEVDKDYWLEKLEPALRSRGYLTSAVSWRQLAPLEGVATCVREATFCQLPRTHSGRLSDLVERLIQASPVTVNDGEKQQEELLRYVDAPQRYQILTLEHRVTGQRLTVGNAHLSYQRPAKPDLRAAQAIALVAETTAIASGEAFIVCGDFNSTPQSLAYQSIIVKQPTSSTAPNSIVTAGAAASSQELPLLAAMPDLFRPKGNTSDDGCCIGSAYLSVFGSEPECTLNLTNNSGCVDFIFYGQQQQRRRRRCLLALAALGVPSCYILRDKDCVPDAQMASDHLSIAAKFAFVNCQENCPA